jgi:hypothetical protein
MVIFAYSIFYVLMFSRFFPQRVRDQFDSSTFPDLASDLSSGFDQMEHADLVLKCGEQEFPCHKFMLGARSDVFRAMFAHDMKENQSGEVILEDAEPKVVKQFLSFIYTDQLDDTSFRTVSRLLPIAEKYNVKRLCALCGQSLLSSMNVDNVSEIAVIGQVRRKQFLSSFNGICKSLWKSSFSHLFSGVQRHPAEEQGDRVHFPGTEFVQIEHKLSFQSIDSV